MPELLRPIKKKNLSKRDVELTMYERTVAKIQFELFLHNNNLPLRIGIDPLRSTDEIRLRRAYEDAGYEVKIENYRYTTDLKLS